jgi:hypothetical protein
MTPLSSRERKQLSKDEIQLYNGLLQRARAAKQSVGTCKLVTIRACIEGNEWIATIPLFDVLGAVKEEPSLMIRSKGPMKPDALDQYAEVNKIAMGHSLAFVPMVAATTRLSDEESILSRVMETNLSLVTLPSLLHILEQGTLIVSTSPLGYALTALGTELITCFERYFPQLMDPFLCLTVKERRSLTRQYKTVLLRIPAFSSIVVVTAAATDDPLPENDLPPISNSFSRCREIQLSDQTILLQQGKYGIHATDHRHRHYSLSHLHKSIHEITAEDVVTTIQQKNAGKVPLRSLDQTHHVCMGPYGPYLSTPTGNTSLALFRGGYLTCDPLVLLEWVYQEQKKRKQKK